MIAPQQDLSTLSDEQLDAMLSEVDNQPVQTLSTPVQGGFTAVQDLSDEQLDAMLAESAPELTTGDYAQQAAHSMIAGFGEMIPSTVDFVGLVGDMVGIGEREDAHAYAEKMREFIRGIVPAVEGAEDSFMASTLPGAIGSTASFFIPGLGATKLAKGMGKTADMIARFGTPASLGAIQQGAAQFYEAEAAGASEEDAWTAFALGTAVGTSEALPISQMLQRADKGSGGLLRRALIEGTEELLQESGQTVASNAIAQSLYEEDRELIEGMVEGGAAGFLTGMLFSSLHTVAGRRLQSRKEVEDAPAAEGATSVQAQVDAFNEKRIPAIFLPPESAVPEGIQGDHEIIRDRRGTLYLTPEAKEQFDAFEETGEDGFEHLGELLGYGTTSKPKEPSAVVTARDAEGRLIRGVLADESTLEAVKASAVATAGEKGTTAVLTLEESAELLQERAGERATVKTASLADAAAVARVLGPDVREVQAPQGTGQAVQKFGQERGRRVAFVERADGSALPQSGYINKSTGTLFLDANGAENEHLWGVMAHEMTHALADEGGDLAIKLQAIAPDAVAAFTEEYAARREKLTGQPIPESLREEEGIALLTENIGGFLQYAAQNPGVLQGIAQADRTLFDRILDAIKEFLGKAGLKFASSTDTRIEALRKQVASTAFERDADPRVLLDLATTVTEALDSTLGQAVPAPVMLLRQGVEGPKEQQGPKKPKAKPKPAAPDPTADIGIGKLPTEEALFGEQVKPPSKRPDAIPTETATEGKLFDTQEGDLPGQTTFTDAAPEAPKKLSGWAVRKQKALSGDLGIVPMMQAMGGVRYDADLAAVLEGGGDTIKGFGKPMHAKGKEKGASFAAFQESLIEDGWFPGRTADDVHPNEVLELVENNALSPEGYERVALAERAEVEREQAAQAKATEEERRAALPEAPFAIAAYEEGEDIRFALAPPEDSKEFKAWFGDSKVVDADGKPLVVYHGTLSEFTEPRQYFWASVDPELSNMYSAARAGEEGTPKERRRSMPVYLSIRNPFNANRLDNYETPTSWVEELIRQAEPTASVATTLRGHGKTLERLMRIEEAGPSLAKHSFWMNASYSFGNEGAELARSLVGIAGFDGVVMFERGHRTYGALNPTQVKSATGNVGTYDPANPDIRFAIPAFHGSGANFDKFSTDKIGTGEGAQAYGWGIYLASRREVATHYRESLSGGGRGGLGLSGSVPAASDEKLSDAAWGAAKDLSKLLVPKPGIVAPFSSLDIVGRRNVLSVMHRLLEDPKVLNSVVSFVPVDVVNMLDGGKYAPEYLLNNPAMLVYLLPPAPENLVPSQVRAVNVLAPLVASAAAKVHTGLGRFDVAPGELASALATGEVSDSVHSRIVPQPSEFTKGHGYQVELAPEADEYLLWDEPLSKQSEKVKGLLQAKAETLPDEPAWGIADAAARELTDAFESLDGNGFYRRLSTGYTKGEVDAGRVAHMLPRSADQAASQALHAAGIRGIKYLDGSSRNRPLRQIKKSFQEALENTADASEVMEEMGTGRFTQEQEDLLNALHKDDWLGFDYPSQAVGAALGADLASHDASPAVHAAVDALRGGGTYNYVIFDAADVEITDRFALPATVTRSKAYKWWTDQTTAFDDQGNPLNESWFQAAQRRIQNKFNRPGVYFAQLRKEGHIVKEAEDVVAAEVGYVGRSKAKVDDFQESHVKPLVRLASKSGLSLEEIDEYLIALHAKDRNRLIAERDPAFDPEKNPGSGVSDSKADETIKRLNAKAGAQLRQIAKITQGMVEIHREALVDGGLSTAEEVAAWQEKFGANYVPLRDIVQGRSGIKVGKGFDIRGSESFRAKGRGADNLADSPITHLIAMVEAGFVRAEKNKVTQTMARAVEAHPNEKWWQLDQEKPKGHKELADWVDRTVHYKLDGEERTITFTDPLMSRAFRNMQPEIAGGAVKFFGSINRILSSLSTSFNPEFVFTNLARDMQTAGLNLSAEQGKGFAKAVVNRKAIWEAGMAIRAMQKANFTGATTEAEKAYLEMREEGGLIGWYHQPDLTTRMESVQKAIDDIDPSSPRKAWLATKALGEWVNDWNSVVEGSVRLSAYMEARRRDMGKRASANLSKQLTVDFNRKGELGTFMNSFYLFFNASVQGTARMFKMARTRRGKQILGGLVAAGAASEALNYMVAGDDEEDGENRYAKIPGYVKNRRWVFWIPGTDRAASFPMPYGFNVPFALGQNMMGAMMGHLDPGEAASRAVSAAWESFNPVGSEASLAQILSPSVVDPFVQASENQTFYGAPIHKDQSPYGPPKPASQLYWSSMEGTGLQKATEALNRLTGGSEEKAGAIDINPEMVEHWLSFIGGGVGRFGQRAVKMVEGALGDAPLEDRDVPFVRQFTVSPSANYYSIQYRENANMLEVERKHVEALEKVNPQAAEIYSDRHKAILDITDEGKATESAIRRLTSHSLPYRLTGEGRNIRVYSKGTPPSGMLSRVIKTEEERDAYIKALKINLNRLVNEARSQP